jgi:pimeloyl-ACP methyl ester carboxylesterase
MPYNLAVLRMDAAEGLQEMYPDIESWYIGGHSLGGSMASSYIEKSGDAFDGLILLGSYSAVDLSGKDIDVLSVYGSEDKVLNKDKYDECKANLPASFQEEIIKGVCHAFFGMYGKQEGDGKPTISNERQIQITADIICDFVN